MTRAEHLAWSKKRALEYVYKGDCMNGLTSMFSDLDKHPETKDHKGIQIGLMLMIGGHLNATSEARRFIEGFN